MTFWYVCKECGYINQVDSAEIEIEMNLDSQRVILSICSECGDTQNIIIEVTGDGL